MKYSFAFELGERVTVPHSPNVQGIIVSAVASIGVENSYLVNAMTDEGRSGSVAYGETLLAGAQSKPRAAVAKASR